MFCKTSLLYYIIPCNSIRIYTAWYFQYGISKKHKRILQPHIFNCYQLYSILWITMKPRN